MIARIPDHPASRIDGLLPRCRKVARDQNPLEVKAARGQFLTEDPVFWGAPNKQSLNDPQSLNSYSYANDNPITKSDSNGLWALKMGAAGTVPGWGLTGEVGIQADLNGVEYYYGAGLAGGAGISLGVSLITPFDGGGGSVIDGR